MTKKSKISQDDFEKLLAWLDADREAAGRKYESIRRKLIKIFFARGCDSAEELTDETIDRVAARVSSIKANYKGDPALYFHGVAKNVLLEFFRKPRLQELPESLKQKKIETDDSDIYLSCLDSCLQNLAAGDREMILDYYRDEKQAKIERRRELTEKKEISLNVLRIRVFRIRKQLNKCVSGCVEKIKM